MLWTPADPTLAKGLWLDAADVDTFSLDGSFISQWRDKSGNNRHATPAIALHPTRDPAGINGRPSVSFGADGGALTTPIMPTGDGATGVTVFAVMMKSGEPVGFSIPFCKGAVNAQWSLVNPSAANGGQLIWRQMTTGLNDRISDGALPLNAARLWGGTVSQSVMRQWWDGLGSGSFESLMFSGSLGADSALTIGGAPDSGYLGNRWQGQFGELLILFSVPSTEGRQQIEGYLAHKWGMSGQLPASHPYLSGPPTAPDLVTISGQAVTASGAAAQAVLIRNWSTHAHVATLTPDSAGDWSADLYAGQYDITYLYDGCAPICHGPYTLTSGG